jgi:hypothetical protein
LVYRSPSGNEIGKSGPRPVQIDDAYIAIQRLEGREFLIGSVDEQTWILFTAHRWK